MLKINKCMKNVNFKISDSTKKFLFAVALTFCVAGVYAQDTSAGTAALTQVTTDIQKYIPIVQKLVYAIAGVVAVIGAVSVYIKMNNEEQDVKNILVLQNWLERIRKEVTNKMLSIKQISDFLNFPILAQPTLKKI